MKWLTGAIPRGRSRPEPLTYRVRPGGFGESSHQADTAGLSEAAKGRELGMPPRPRAKTRRKATNGAGTGSAGGSGGLGPPG